jgi:hypothetical protein
MSNQLEQNMRKQNIFLSLKAEVDNFDQARNALFLALSLSPQTSYSHCTMQI